MVSFRPPLLLAVGWLAISKSKSAMMEKFKYLSRSNWNMAGGITVI